MRLRALRYVAAGAIAVLATACGTTVQLGSGSSLSSGSSSGLGLGTDLAPTTTGSNASQGDATTPGGSSAETTVGSADAGATGSSTTGPAALPSSAAAVVASTAPIQVGIPYVNSSSNNTFVNAIGPGLASNDTRAVYTDYINYFNAHGGILGRKIQPVFDEISIDDSTSQMDQEVCSYFTQDHKVSFVMSVDPGGTLYSCLSKAGVASIADGVQETAEPIMSQEPLAVVPDSIALDRYSTLEVPQLNAMGFLGHTSKDKLGVMYFSNVAASVEGYKALVQALAAIGVKIAVSDALTLASSTAGLAGMESEVQGAELKFKAAGITEVTCEETTPWACAFFAIYANGQNYFPRYAFSSAESLTSIVSDVPARALKDSVFLGWYPAQDMQSVSEMPASVQACFKVFEAQGLSISDGNERAQAEAACADVNVLAAALRVAPSISAAGFIQGVEHLGSAFKPLGTFAESFSNTQRDGVSEIRRGEYETSCSCYQYTSGLISIG